MLFLFFLKVLISHKTPGESRIAGGVLTKREQKTTNLVGVRREFASHNSHGCLVFFTFLLSTAPSPFSISLQYFGRMGPFFLHSQAKHLLASQQASLSRAWPAASLMRGGEREGLARLKYGAHWFSRGLHLICGATTRPKVHSGQGVIPHIPTTLSWCQKWKRHRKA